MDFRRAENYVATVGSNDVLASLWEGGGPSLMVEGECENFICRRGVIAASFLPHSLSVTFGASSLPERALSNRSEL